MISGKLQIQSKCDGCKVSSLYGYRKSETQLMCLFGELDRMMRGPVQVNIVTT